MDWNWISENPAEAAWLAFGVLSVCAVAYGRMEPRLKAWAGRSDTTVDDKLVWGLSHTVGLLTLVLDVFRELAPTFIGAQSSPLAQASPPFAAQEAEADEPSSGEDDLPTDLEDAPTESEE